MTREDPERELQEYSKNTVKGKIRYYEYARSKVIVLQHDFALRFDGKKTACEVLAFMQY